MGEKNALTFAAITMMVPRLVNEHITKLPEPAAGRSVAAARINDKGDMVLFMSDGEELPVEGNIRGPIGARGPRGQRGNTLASARIDSGNLILVMEDATEILVGPVLGEIGPEGPAGPSGPVGASVLDLYFNESRELSAVIGHEGSDDNNIINLGNIHGEPGPQGPEGPAGCPGTNGTSVTDVELSPEGVLVISLMGPDGAVERVLAGNVRGPEGIEGKPGPAGEPGKNGLNGRDGEDGKDGLPGAGYLGAVIQDKCLMLRHVNALGEETELNLGPVCGSDGAPGPQGVSGPEGPEGPEGPMGPAGRGITSVHIDEVTNHLVVAFDTGEQEDLGNLRGPRGQRGARGPSGEEGVDGVDGMQGLGFAWMGQYQKGATYYGQQDEDNPNPGQAAIVRYKGSTYIAVAPVSEPPGTDVKGWEPF